MEHISGSLNQHTFADDGPFIKLGEFRVRKNLIKAYTLINQDDKGVPTNGINLLIPGGWMTTLLGFPQEEVEKAIQQLDWNFEKDYKDWK